MHKLIASVIAVTITLSISTGAAAQTATPFALPATPNPLECGIAPRTTEELEALLATPPVEAPLNDAAVEGVPADTATTAFAVSIMREALACGNAHGFPGVTALISDEALARDVLGGQQGKALSFDSSAAPPEADERHVLVAVQDVSLLDDGRVGALAVIEGPEHGRIERRFTVVLADHVPGADGSDQYLFLIDRIDALALDRAADDPETGTPAP